MTADAAKMPGRDAQFDGHASEYDEQLGAGLKATGEGKEFFARGRVRFLASILQTMGARLQSILDFGCGTGGSLEPLEAAFAPQSITGFDPSQISLEIAAALPSGAAARAFASDSASLRPASFDLAFTNGVFHHIPPQERPGALRVISDALREGGLFAFWENNRWNPIVHFLMSKVPFDCDAQMLFPFQARALLRQAGFEIVGTWSCFIFPASLAFLRPLERWLTRLPLGGQYLVLVRKTR